MNTRRLGHEGPEISEIGLGCLGMSDFYGPRDQNEAVATIHHALDLGVTFFDTADAYGPFKNEQLLGRALRGKRERVVVATKFGQLRGADGAFLGVNGRPEYVRSCIDASLRRLGMDYVDVYYQHRVDPLVPIEETVGAMAELVRSGKVRYLGLSEASPGTIRRAHAVHPIAALQSEYSLWSREPEDEILPTLRALGIGFVAYSPLGRGFLTGTLKRYEDLAPDDLRRCFPRFQGENFAKNLAAVVELKKVAARRGVAPAAVAIAWLLSRGQDIIALPGTKQRLHLEENLSATSFNLTPAERMEVERACPRGWAAGPRYPDMSLLNG